METINITPKWKGLMPLYIELLQNGKSEGRKTATEELTRLAENADNINIKFPNGFDSWHETHFEIVQAITQEISKDEPTGVVNERHEAQGHGGLYELAQELTDKFEQLNEGREWDGEFFDEIEIFINKELTVTN